MNSDENKTWKLDVIDPEDGSDDYMVILPDQFLTELNLKIGDSIWIYVSKNTISLRKMNPDDSRVQAFGLWSKNHKEINPDYEPDDGPLTEDDIQRIKEAAAQFLPKGKVIKLSSLFDLLKDYEPTDQLTLPQRQELDSRLLSFDEDRTIALGLDELKSK